MKCIVNSRISINMIEFYLIIIIYYRSFLNVVIVVSIHQHLEIILNE